jgi:hypothetical protein
MTFTNVPKILFNTLLGFMPFLDVIFNKIPKGKPNTYAKTVPIRVMPRVSKIANKTSTKLIIHAPPHI